MKTIIGETAIPDGTYFPPSWPHKVLQAAVAMRTAYGKAGRAGGPTAEALEVLGNALVDAVSGDLQEKIVPSSAGHLTDPFSVPEHARSAADEVLPPSLPENTFGESPPQWTGALGRGEF